MAETTLFTIFLDYRGGTYISQTTAVDPSQALVKWAVAIPREDLAEWKLQREVLLASISEGSLVPIAHRVNVWCLSGVDEDEEQLLLNIVSTVNG